MTSSCCHLATCLPPNTVGSGVKREGDSGVRFDRREHELASELKGLLVTTLSLGVVVIEVTERRSSWGAPVV